MEWKLELILFVLLSVMAVFSAIMMVTRRSPINSAIFLIINFFASAGIYLLLQAQFIAVIQVLVYMGAIMVLVIFVIMLLNLQDESKLSEQFSYKKLTSLLLSVLLFCLLGFSVFFGFSGKFTSISGEAEKLGTAESLGKELVLAYSVPFEIAGLLLLAAVVGAVVLAKKSFD
ncbi:MAG: NADH-quinone oxidoreductase subunit J [Ignavibacteriaceae bacterium]|jgi:NADH:ubiquinone oxidoreductase subunit 6 (chain J)|nr:MAG: NADH dehydrogenase subunit J [Chlorobi bacterium OLB4]MBW7854796.1 NADH-quinone oxidoreductase subunit J [Ignavibacteria bacterium]MEB2329965.1 NADH-quinone oxidoreductase subunit J [Ignavibacteriaceae bacterium]OQY78378.1 MAG: hypothetical protein B6D43_02630 [Ignavibacteriales bacterium UTCHB1]